MQVEDTSEWEESSLIGIHECFVSRTQKNAATLFSYLYVKFCQCRRFKSLFKRLKVSDIGNQQYEKWSKVFKTCSSLSFSQRHPCCLLRKHFLNVFFFFLFFSCCWHLCFLPFFFSTFLYNILTPSSWWKLLRYTNALSLVFNGHLKHSLLLYSFTVMPPCSAPGNQYCEPNSLGVMTTLYCAVTIILS